MNYANLIQNITENIKTNGSQAITAQVLQDVLVDMVGELGQSGALLGGVIDTSFVPALTNDAQVVYIAKSPGTYTNFNGLVVGAGEVAFFYFDGNAWAKSSVDVLAVVNNLNSTATDKALSAAMGKQIGDNISQLSQEVNGIRYIDNVSYSGAHNAEFQFSEVSNDTAAILRISGTWQNINYCVWYHGTTNAGLLAISDYTNAEVTIPATANKLKVFLKSGTTLDIIVNLKTSGVNERVTTAENDIDGLSESIASLNDSVADLDERVTELENEATETETIGADPAGNFPQSTNNTNYIWAISTPAVSGEAIKINFKAKEGTVNFYKVHAETIAIGESATITQIASVNNTSAEEGTVKSVVIDVEFGENDYLGINGAFYYNSSSSEPDFTTFFANVSTSNIESTPSAFTAGCNIVIEVTKSVRTIPENIVFVDAKGNGDFLNPFDAMVALSGKDTAANPYTIVVAPGVYNMPTLPRDKFSAYCGNRYLAIVGTDKQNCILRNDKGYYNAAGSDPNNLGDNSPLKISGNIYIANLTIISTDTENASESAEEYHLSYCIHIDAGAMEGSIMEVHNCRLVNNHAPCIGFGIPKNVTLKITDCDLESNFYNPNLTYGGAIVYGHDRDGSTSEVQEHLIIRNCVLKSSNGNAVKFVNNNNALADCVFIGNACDLPTGKGIVLGAGTTVVFPSFGNNLSEMNA